MLAERDHTSLFVVFFASDQGGETGNWESYNCPGPVSQVMTSVIFIIPRVWLLLVTFFPQDFILESGMLVSILPLILELGRSRQDRSL